MKRELHKLQFGNQTMEIVDTLLYDLYFQKGGFKPVIELTPDIEECDSVKIRAKLLIKKVKIDQENHCSNIDDVLLDVFDRALDELNFGLIMALSMEIWSLYLEYPNAGIKNSASFLVFDKMMDVKMFDLFVKNAMKINTTSVLSLAVDTENISLLDATDMIDDKMSPDSAEMCARMMAIIAETQKTDYKWPKKMKSEFLGVHETLIAELIRSHVQSLVSGKKEKPKAEVKEIENSTDDDNDIDDNDKIKETKEKKKREMITSDTETNDIADEKKDQQLKINVTKENLTFKQKKVMKMVQVIERHNLWSRLVERYDILSMNDINGKNERKFFSYMAHAADKKLHHFAFGHCPIATIKAMDLLIEHCIETKNIPLFTRVTQMIDLTDQSWDSALLMLLASARAFLIVSDVSNETNSDDEDEQSTLQFGKILIDAETCEFKSDALKIWKTMYFECMSRFILKVSKLAYLLGCADVYFERIKHFVYEYDDKIDTVKDSLNKLTQVSRNIGLLSHELTPFQKIAEYTRKSGYFPGWNDANTKVLFDWLKATQTCLEDYKLLSLKKIDWDNENLQTNMNELIKITIKLKNVQWLYVSIYDNSKWADHSCFKCIIENMKNNTSQNRDPELSRQELFYHRCQLVDYIIDQKEWHIGSLVMDGIKTIANGVKNAVEENCNVM